MQNNTIDNPEFCQQFRQRWQWLLNNQSEVGFDFPLPDYSFLSDHTPDGTILLKTRSVTIAKPSAKPSLKNLNTSVLDHLQEACLLSDPPIWLFEWSETLLRVCELRRLDLKNRLIENGNQSGVKTKTLRLCLFFLNCFRIYNDARYLNIVLKIIGMDWLKIKGFSTSKNQKITVDAFLESLLVLAADAAVATVKSPGWHTDIVHPNSKQVLAQIELPMHKVCQNSPEVVVFCANPYSLSTLCTMELLQIHGVKIKGVVVRRLVNPNRLIREIRRDGWKWVYKKIKEKLLFRKSSYRGFSFDTLSDLSEKIGLKSSSIAKWCSEHSSEMIACNNLNDANVRDYLLAAKPRLAVFCGGGIVRENIIELSGDGVLNCHAGLLPRYRGLDNHEWPLLEKHPDAIGCTTHFMSKYVDEGDILFMFKGDVSNSHNIEGLIKYMEVWQIKLLAFSVIKYLENESLLQAQRKEDGRQYFYMHPKLVSVAKQNLVTYT